MVRNSVEVWFVALVEQTISRTQDKSHSWEILRDLALHSLREHLSECRETNLIFCLSLNIFQIIQLG